MPHRRRSLAQALVLVSAFVFPSLLFSQAYPIKVEKAVSFESLSVSVNRVSLQVGKGAMVLIECEQGVTGVVLLASGRFAFATNDAESVHDTFTNALLRFNPSNYDDMIAAVAAKPASQAELLNQATDVLRRSFLRLYHKGNDALIPPAGVLGAVLYADKLGDVIVSEGGEGTGVYSLSGRSVLFDGGASTPVPAFQGISKNWLQKVTRQRMDGIWKKEGIAASGENYFFFPTPADGKSHSRRFDPGSNYFQAWFGMYVMKNDAHGAYGFAGGQPDARAILRLLMADQRAWLMNFAGMESAVVALDEQTPVACVKTSAAGLDGWKITGRLLSNADVGEKNPASGRPEFLLPPSTVWKNNVSSYARIGLDIVVYVLPNTEKKETYVVYYNGIDFVDKSGVKHTTLPELLSEMEAMVGSLKAAKR